MVGARQYAAVSAFACLKADCPDTCCRGWDMPTDARQLSACRAHAPELLNGIDEAQGVMRRNEQTRECVQLCEGECRIHRDYGAQFLGDGCYFYPRQIHALGDEFVVSGASSCPEMLRLMLTQREPFALQEVPLARAPLTRRNLLPQGISQAQAEQVLANVMAIAGKEANSPAQAVDALVSLALEMDGEIVDTPAQCTPADFHAIYYALALTEAFGRTGISQGLAAVMQVMEQALDCQFDRESRQLQLGPQATQRYTTLRIRWQVDAQRALAPAMRRWLQAQVAMTLFPFGGFSDATYRERAAVLVQRFATMRLALMCHVTAASIPPDEATVLRVMQALARFQDHLADMKLTRMIHRDSGWESVARLRGLVVG